MNSLKVLLYAFIILLGSTGSHSKDLHEHANKEAKLNLKNAITAMDKNPVLLSKAAKAQQGDECAGAIINFGCDTENLLLCLEGRCTCPVMDHDELMELVRMVIGQPIPIPPGFTTEFALNTTWVNEKCVGNEGSLCIANLPPEAEGYVPFKFACASGLSCAPYPDKELQGIIGRCGASSIFATTALFLVTLFAYFV